MLVFDSQSWQKELKIDSVLSLPVRFDRGSLLRKAEITPEGYLRADAVYCRDGILEYRTPSGKIRKELRLPEANQAALQDFGLKPYTTEHPPVLLDAKNAKQYAQGFSDSTVFYDPKSGFVRGVIAVFDSDAIESITDGRTVEISAGYQCAVREEPGIWQGERYDAIQELLRPNHLAGTVKGRAGENVRFLNLFDSCASIYNDVAYEDPGATDTKYFDFGNKPAKKTMASITRNGLTFEDVPGDLANFINQELTKADSELEDNAQYIEQLETAARTDAESINTLNTQISEYSEEANRQMGRADELEVYLTNADSILADMGYRRDSDGDYYAVERNDKKGKTNPSLDEILDDLDDKDSEEDVEEEVVTKKKTKSKSKAPVEEWSDDDMAMEDDEMEEEIVTKKKHTKEKHTKKDSVADLFKAWKSVEKIVPGIMESEHFDSELDLDGIKAIEITAMKQAIQEAQPDRNLEGRSDSYIEGVYEGLGLSAETNNISRVDHTSNLDVVLNAAARHGGTSPLQKAREEVKTQLSDAWKTPLTMSTRSK